MWDLTQEPFGGLCKKNSTKNLPKIALFSSGMNRQLSHNLQTSGLMHKLILVGLGNLRFLQLHNEVELFTICSSRHIMIGHDWIISLVSKYLKIITKVPICNITIISLSGTWVFDIASIHVPEMSIYSKNDLSSDVVVVSMYAPFDKSMKNYDRGPTDHISSQSKLQQITPRPVEI